VAVMVSCQPDIFLITANATRPKTLPFFTSTLMTSEGCHRGICVVGPYIGAPYAVMLLESLIARGASKIIVLGWCGAVTHGLSVGDLVLPSKALVDEGTSRHYKNLSKDIPCSLPDKTLMDQLAGHLVDSNLEFQKTAIWTTDAIYRETLSKVEHFRQLGAKAVEMECSALFSVAEYRRVSIAAILIVSDSVASKDWAPGFRKKQFKLARKNVCESVMTFAEKLCKNE